ncbi:hypothetical protein HaLaN_00642 [Haematococcus lacustris]|uniref:Uncharacterized protein n=1 Tax=Haematococcus lacustris TaxID=44745 RepID=A0A699Y7N5_HAELA|nr:hypothetical protein HaLaN_00642 [Haematococcus lacustris]
MGLESCIGSSYWHQQSGQHGGFAHLLEPNQEGIDAVVTSVLLPWSPPGFRAPEPAHVGHDVGHGVGLLAHRALSIANESGTAVVPYREGGLVVQWEG